MDALKNLAENCPSWDKRLDELVGHIKKRQAELAAFAQEQRQNNEQHGGCNGDGAPRSSVKSQKRKSGSIESLRPRDDIVPHFALPSQAQSPNATPLATPLTTPDAPRLSTSGLDSATPKHAANGHSNSIAHPAPTSPGNESITPSTLQRQATQVMQIAQAAARETVRRVANSIRKQRFTDSMISAEGQAPRYRTRSIVLVYYDSYVQSFFEELIRFVSASRNLMRRARMAAKVAQLKRQAEMDMPRKNTAAETTAPLRTKGSNPPPANESHDRLPGEVALSSPGTGLEIEHEPDATVDKPVDGAKDERLPELEFISSRRMTPVARKTSSPFGAFQPATFTRARDVAFGHSINGGAHAVSADMHDIYDELDKNLEYVQSQCEHAAHQFLRDGDCGEEIENMRKSLTAIIALADQELVRAKKEDPIAFDAPPEPRGARSYRPQSVRKPASAMALSSTYAAHGPAVAPVKAGDIPLSPYKTPEKIIKHPEPVITPCDTLEVDEGIDGCNDGEESEPPKLEFKSTRMMRRMGSPL